MALSINQDVWDGLPEEVQIALSESAEPYRLALAQYAMGEANQSIEDMKAAGATIVEVSQEDREKWVAGLDDIASEWVADASALGAPAQDILTDYIAAMRENGQTILRDWSAQ